MVKYIGCRLCKDEKYIYKTDEVTGEAIATPCHCFTEFLRKRKVELEALKANFTEFDLQYDISTYEGTESLSEIENLKKYADRFLEKYHDKSLFIYGGASTQKTTVAKWVGKRIIEKGKKAHYVLMNDLIKDCQNAQFDDSETSEIKNLLLLYETVDLLIIDEAFVKDRNTIFKSRAQIPYIDSFFRTRLETKRLATIFISNEPIEMINEEIFNSYIKELIRRNCFPMEFKDRIGSSQRVEDIFKD